MTKTYEIYTFEHLVVVRWYRPTPAGANELLKIVRQVNAATKRRVEMLVMISETSTLPDAECRAAFALKLASYDIQRHSTEIIKRLRARRMLPDGAHSNASHV